MKTILLIRHAKSSWDNVTLKDEDRPLNERGKKNAPEMAARLLKKEVSIDAFISSPAKRALTTAEIFAIGFGVNKKEIIIKPELYMANGETFTKTIRNAPKEANTIALFSHNNGITDFANLLSDVKIDNMPTCSIFAVQCKIETWSQFMPSGNKFYFFDYPKAL